MDSQNRNRGQRVVQEARELIRTLQETASVRRVSLSAGNLKIEVDRVLPRGTPAPLAAPEPEAAEAAPAERGHALPSPLVGTFYHAPKPDGKPFVEVGGRVQVGQPIGVIDVLGIKNPVLSDTAGVVQAVLVPNGQRVEFDQPLIVIETSAS